MHMALLAGNTDECPVHHDLPPAIKCLGEGYMTLVTGDGVPHTEVVPGPVAGEETAMAAAKDFTAATKTHYESCHGGSVVRRIRCRSEVYVAGANRIRGEDTQERRLLVASTEASVESRVRDELVPSLADQGGMTEGRRRW